MWLGGSRDRALRRLLRPSGGGVGRALAPGCAVAPAASLAGSAARAFCAGVSSSAVA